MKNSEQSAFPISTGIIERCGAETNPMWLSKREYFAGLAMQGYLAGDDKTKVRLSGIAENQMMDLKTLIAKLSVEYADELLTQLSK